MRSIVVLVAGLALAACGTVAGTQTDANAVKSGQSPAATLQEPSAAAAMEFLLTSAATDFHAHPPVEAIRVRNVRIGHLLNPDGAEQYLLCGEFSSAKDTGNAEHTPFATIKTHGYEQWIGAQAVGLCQRDSITWDNTDDLSALLQSRLDALGGR